MIHWRNKLTLLGVAALTALAAIGGGFSWGSDTLGFFW
jgi:hypothetical protein